MATQAYQQWMNAGQPYATAQPVAELAITLRSHGFTVYVKGDYSHNVANPPEDHTAYSATGWPAYSARWWGHACDIMPGGAVNLGRLAQQLVADRDAGVAAWIKYVNVTLPGQSCQHISWEPNKRVTPSSDAGHIHLSVRTDYTHSGIGGYDPVARINGGGTPGRAPAWPGRYLKLGMSGEDVRTWQQRMLDRGWAGIGQADGDYGPKTDTVCRQFQTEKSLQCDGVVGQVTWVAAWLSSIT